MSFPELDIDLFTDDALQNFQTLAGDIRAKGPVVSLTAHDVVALSRYADVRAALRSDNILVSGQGVGLNDFMNGMRSRTTLISDGELHRQRRSTLIKPMMPRTLADVRPTLEAMSSELVTDLVSCDSFDGITDFAQFLPVTVVSHLVGLPEAGRERMLEWSAATFNALGPANRRHEEALAGLAEMGAYAAELERDSLAPDGWAAQLFVAAERGDIDSRDVRGLLIDYIAPSLDTTLLGAGWLLYLFSRYPDQFDLVKQNPDLIPSAVHEVLRFESPVRAFTRVAVADYNEGDVAIPANTRVLILYGAANRDERQYDNPDVFDVTRNARDHMAFGQGQHRCAGAHLAQYELEALLLALVNQVRRIECDEPEMLMSNMLHGLRKMPTTLVS